MVLLELNCEIDTHAEILRLDAGEQLRELTAAITAHRAAEQQPVSKEELLSRLLSVATAACTKLEEVSAAHFGAAREALRTLRDGLKEIYMVECIPY